MCLMALNIFSLMHLHDNPLSNSFDEVLWTQQPAKNGQGHGTAGKYGTPKIDQHIIINRNDKSEAT